MKPILFNTDMVRAILEGRKIETRRIVKGQNKGWEFIGLEENPDILKVNRDGEEYPFPVNGLWATFEWDGLPDYPMVKAPYQPGDILYVRETWNRIRFGNGGKVPFRTEYWYKADDKLNDPDEKWRPSIHMPREAARIFLRVTDVRVERLQDMPVLDIAFEGFRRQRDFIAIWNSTIKPTDRARYGWEANPFVWVIEFERIRKEEAENGLQRADSET